MESLPCTLSICSVPVVLNLHSPFLMPYPPEVFLFLRREAVSPSFTPRQRFSWTQPHVRTTSYSALQLLRLFFPFQYLSSFGQWSWPRCLPCVEWVLSENQTSGQAGWPNMLTVSSQCVHSWHHRPIWTTDVSRPVQMFFHVAKKFHIPLLAPSFLSEFLKKNTALRLLKYRESTLSDLFQTKRERVQAMGEGSWGQMSH